MFNKKIILNRITFGTDLV